MSSTSSSKSTPAESLSATANRKSDSAETAPVKAPADSAESAVHKDRSTTSAASNGASERTVDSLPATLQTEQERALEAMRENVAKQRRKAARLKVAEDKKLDAEVEEILAGLSSVSLDDSPLLLNAIRDAIREQRVVARDPRKRIWNEIVEKYGFDEDKREIAFDDSDEARRDRDMLTIIHSLNSAEANLRMIAEDEKLSSRDVIRYTRDGAAIYTPAQVAANALETNQKFLRDDLKKDEKARTAKTKAAEGKQAVVRVGAALTRALEAQAAEVQES